MTDDFKALVGVIMGGKSDWETMQFASQILNEFEIPHESKVISAHRTPDLMIEYAKTAEERGLQVIIAGAGGAAPSSGDDRVVDVGSCVGSTRGESSTARRRFVALHRADAYRGACWGHYRLVRRAPRMRGLLAVQILACNRPDLRERLKRFRANTVTRIKGEHLF